MVDNGEEEEAPVNASQNAEPNFLNTVWLAMAANIACCCSFSLCCCCCCCCTFSLATPFELTKGEPGRVLDDALCLPDRSAESAVPPYVEGKFGLLDEEKYNGRRFDASPEFDVVEDDEW